MLEPGDLVKFTGNSNLVQQVCRAPDSFQWIDVQWGNIEQQYPCFVVEPSALWFGFYIVMVSSDRYYRVHGRMLQPV